VILSDGDIDRIIKSGQAFLVSPYNDENLQPNSIDLTLGDELKTIHGKSIDLSQDSYKLKPNEFILGSTIERVSMPLDLCGHIDGKSSIGRLGVFIENSGFVDSGFVGNITLEIYNASDKEFELIHGMPICQILFQTLTSPVSKPYGTRDNHYQHSNGTVLSKWEEYK
jgi:dCTP deaminase